MAATTVRQHQDRGVPDGYVAIPISAGQRAAPVRISVLARASPDPVGGVLVTVRQAADARVYLGALIDVGGRVHAWLEVWVQDLGGLGQALAGWRESLTNAVLDQRWWASAESAWAAEGANVVRTGWESRHPVPVWLDVARGEPVALADGTGETWKLCQDEAVLAAAGLPSYARSLHRYLYLPKKGVDGGFVPVTPAAPTNQHARPASLPLGGRTDLAPFNPAGGLLLVRELVGPSLEAYVDLLAGATGAQPVLHGRTPIHLFGPGGGGGLRAPAPARASPDPDGPGPAAARRDGTGDGWLLLGTGRAGGRCLEGLYLRLRLLADVAEAVRAHHQRTGLPLLNVEPARFQVHLGRARSGLPAFWTARAVLVDPGDAVAVRAGSGGTNYFLPARPLPASAYRRTSIGLAADGPCEVRVARVTDAGGGTVAVEGTAVGEDRVDAGPRDLVRLWLPVGDGRTRIDATLDRPGTANLRERRFRSFPALVAAPALDALRAAEGTTVRAATYEVIPRTNAGWDLYSVATVGVRALLANASNSPGAAVGELTSLAAKAAADPAPGDPVSVRVRRAVAAEPRYAKTLGPHRLLWDGAPGDRTAAAVPPELWWDVLATLIEPLIDDGCGGSGATGGPNSSGGTDPSGQADGLSGADLFDDFLGKLDDLLIRAQSLFVPDWEQNREMRSVIDRLLGSDGFQSAATPGQAG